MGGGRRVLGREEEQKLSRGTEEQFKNKKTQIEVCFG